MAGSYYYFVLAVFIILFVNADGQSCNCKHCQIYSDQAQRCMCCAFHGVGGKRSSGFPYSAYGEPPALTQQFDAENRGSKLSGNGLQISNSDRSNDKFYETNEDARAFSKGDSTPFRKLHLLQTILRNLKPKYYNDVMLRFATNPDQADLLQAESTNQLSFERLSKNDLPGGQYLDTSSPTQKRDGGQRAKNNIIAYTANSANPFLYNNLPTPLVPGGVLNPSYLHAFFEPTVFQQDELGNILASKQMADEARSNLAKGRQSEDNAQGMAPGFSDLEESPLYDVFFFDNTSSSSRS